MSEQMSEHGAFQEWKKWWTVITWCTPWPVIKRSFTAFGNVKYPIVEAMLHAAQSYFWALRLRDFQDNSCLHRGCCICSQFNASALPEVWRDNFDRTLEMLQLIFLEMDKDENHPARERLNLELLFTPRTERATMALLSPSRILMWKVTISFSTLAPLVYAAANRMVLETPVSDAAADRAVRFIGTSVKICPENPPKYTFEWVDFLCSDVEEELRLTAQAADGLREKRDRRHKAISQVLVGELSLPFDVCRFVVLPYCSLW